MAPRACWCYGPESFMSMVKTISRSCDRGTPAWKMAEKICIKFCLSYELLLKGWLSLE